MKVGLDVGSTTIKCVVLDEKDNIIYSTYERHFSHILEKARELLRRVAEEQLPGGRARFAISGSAGMGMAESVGVPFVQEVFATRVAANRLVPGTDVIIELGGEDAKILFLTNGMEVRMNGSCAGGTGAFIDQMATLLKMSADEMDAAAQRAEKTYTIASRCGVFAKSDIQPLINQGARAEDIAVSIYQAVVNQTVAGLAQGRPIRGNVLYLGGPLTFSRCLRHSFDETLGVKGTCPENSLLFVALGAAFYSDEEFDLNEVVDRLEARGGVDTYRSQPALFASREEYEQFRARHAKAAVPHVPFGPDYSAPVHIGIDSGSTTVKLVVIDQEARLLFSDYRPNLGNPVPLIRQVLQQLHIVFRNGACRQFLCIQIIGRAVAKDDAVFHIQLGILLCQLLQQAVIGALLSMDHLQFRQILQALQVIFCQGSDGDFFGVVSIEAVLEGNIPGNMAFRQLLRQSLVLLHGDEFSPQIQAFQILGIEIKAHHHIMGHIPQHTRRHTGQQQDADQNHKNNFLTVQTAIPPGSYFS